ncbi:hypothetical protein GCM10009551_014540 [Nocardiopsis tropica]
MRSTARVCARCPPGDGGAESAGGAHTLRWNVRCRGHAAAPESDPTGTRPFRAVAEVARHGLSGKATPVCRRGTQRRSAALVATVVRLRARTVDDAPALLEASHR